MESELTGRAAVGMVVAALALTAAVLWLPLVLVTAPEPRTNSEIREASALLEGDEMISFDEAEEIRLNEESTRARNVSDTRRTVLAAVAGLVGLGLGWLTWRRTAAIERNSKAVEGQLEVAQANQVTDAFARAIEQLGTRTDDDGGLEVRLGGLYTLERIAKNSHDDRSTIAEVLGAFVRSNAGIPADDEQIASQPTDVQAALTIIGRFSQHGPAESFDLSQVDLTNSHLGGSDLTGVDLTDANLTNANLTNAKLNGANLNGANLNGAYLTGADLTTADLIGANLTDANLTDANLTTAHLIGAALNNALLFGADFSGAHLTNAKLKGAYLNGTNLTDAYLSDADLTAADLSDADLTTADLIGAKLSGANLTDANLTDADLTNADLAGASVIGANLTNANLTDAKLTSAKLDGAFLNGTNLNGAYLPGPNPTDVYVAGVTYNEWTVWPEGLEPPPSADPD